MTSSSIPSLTSPTAAPDQRQALWRDLDACRQSTLAAVEGITPAELCRQSHADFSPVGWHLGHIAFTESLWVLEHLKGDPCPYPQYRRLFAADGLPKAAREDLPPLADLLAFLADIRDRTLTYLETAPLPEQLRLWRWLLQHESQHAETLSFVLELHRWPQKRSRQPAPLPQPVAAPRAAEMCFFPGGDVTLGNQSIDALDNERPVHGLHLPSYWIDRIPVTIGAYRTFITAGGYQNPQWWTPEGWAWVQQQGITQPLYWRSDPAWNAHPVCGVSGYEADAYARFVGKRLPTEAEWEAAACWDPVAGRAQLYPWGDAFPDRHRANIHQQVGHTTAVGQYPAGRSPIGCDDMLGNVWEWTATWFDRYPGFQAYPYRGYSEVYFDGCHRVLRGGSWATRPWGLRAAFRNWYQPPVRQLFAGFRCALSA